MDLKDHRLSSIGIGRTDLRHDGAGSLAATRLTPASAGPLDDLGPGPGFGTLPGARNEVLPTARDRLERMVAVVKNPATSGFLRRGANRFDRSRWVRRLQGRRVVARRLAQKSRSCADHGSTLYASLLAHAARDVEAGGPCWNVLRDHEALPAVAMRFMGGVHRLVLQGRAPALARYYPSVGGGEPPTEAWGQFLSTVERNDAELRASLARPVQRNEVIRCGALLGGFLMVARETGLPLRLLEFGASAGLNLRWDQYRYQGQGFSWGDERALVQIPWQLTGPVPPIEIQPEISSRMGCDTDPLDPESPEDCLTLVSYEWADQVDQIETLRRALQEAARVPAVMERARADAWLGERLGEIHAGAATVVFDSCVMQFLDAADRRSVAGAIAEAGRRATDRAPLAHLRLRSSRHGAAVVLTTWPGSHARVLATATRGTGQPVRWLVA